MVYLIFLSIMLKRKASTDVQPGDQQVRKRQKHSPDTIAPTNVTNFNSTKALKSHKDVLKSKRADLANLHIIQTDLKKLPNDRGYVGTKVVKHIIAKSERQIKTNEFIVTDLEEHADDSVYHNLPSHINQVAMRTMERYAHQNPRHRVDEFYQEVATAIMDTALLKGDMDVIARFDKKEKAKCDTEKAIDHLLGRLEDTTILGSFQTQVYSTLLKTMKGKSDGPAMELVKEITSIIEMALNTAPKVKTQPLVEKPDIIQLTNTVPSSASTSISPSHRGSSVSQGVEDSFTSVETEDYREVSPMDEDMKRLAGTTRSGTRRSTTVKPSSTQKPDKAAASTPRTQTGRIPGLMYTKRPHLKTRAPQASKKN
ncbi:uncharacterized protein N0V89_001967 [Didymosphaeria variabile]|uniref:Uncharacterized protein n=1 Tax=Didymosphaeria variabile TaxID=1932322 RepID=A0A9W8XTX2_9PLEO|nr:uncharacterized protein N0V89_001967 [Didymosphaeria variabile]KAJ4357392.1 hypothetical protein N0V89_001967 [Didymosphaeria variabile]